MFKCFKKKENKKLSFPCVYKLEDILWFAENSIKENLKHYNGDSYMTSCYSGLGSETKETIIKYYNEREFNKNFDFQNNPFVRLDYIYQPHLCSSICGGDFGFEAYVSDFRYDENFVYLTIPHYGILQLTRKGSEVNLLSQHRINKIKEWYPELKTKFNKD